MYCTSQSTGLQTLICRKAQVLLGADPQSHEDGLLQVREIARLHFNAELVTLSACDTGPQGSPQNRPTVVTSKPANESGLGLSCFTPPPPVEASLFSCANSVDRI